MDIPRMNPLPPAVVRRLLPAAVLVSALATGCRTFAAPSPELLAVLRAAPAPPSCLRQRVRADIESPWIRGTFDGVLLARMGERPSVRLQLFPELGGLALDLLATPDRIAGFLPAAGAGSDHPVPLTRRPDALVVLGAALLEAAAPASEQRALGMIEEPDGWRVRLRPVVADFDVVASLDPSGRVLVRRFGWGWAAAWDQVHDGDGGFSLQAGGATVRLRVLDTRSPSRLPEGFEKLKLPDGTVPLQEIPP